MRSLVVLGAFLVGSAAFAQTPAPAAPAAPVAPAVRRPAAAPAARSGMAITVTDSRGTILPGIHAEVLGTSDRSGDTNGNGQLSLTAMQPGGGDAGTNIAVAFRELAQNASKIGELNISPELLRALMPASAKK